MSNDTNERNKAFTRAMETMFDDASVCHACGLPGERPAPPPPTEFLRTQIGAVVRRAVERHTAKRNADFFDALQAELAAAGHSIARTQ